MSLFKKNVMTLIIGSFVILATLAVFFSLSYPKAHLDHIEFFTVLAAEVISIACFLVFNKASSGSSKVMISAGAYTAILVYVIAAIIFSVFFLVYFRHMPNTYLVVEVIFLALLFVALIVIYTYGKKVAQENDETTVQLTAMGILESNIQLMRNNPMNHQYVKQLDMIYEAIKSCDQSVYTKTDQLISSRAYDLNQIMQTPDGSVEKVNQLLGHMMQLINQRTSEVRQLKRGGI